MVQRTLPYPWVVARGLSLGLLWMLACGKEPVEPTTETVGVATAVGSTGPVETRAPVILRSEDFGSSWVSQDGGPPDGTFLEDVSFVDAMTGTAVGFNAFGGGVILRTEDGGETWSPQDGGSTALTCVAFIDARIGWAAGVNKVRRTTNDGVTWLETEVTTDTFIKDIAFSDAMTGTAVGVIFNPTESPTILRTTDGGVTWTEQAQQPFVVSDVTLWGVCFSDALTGTVVGDGGTILRTVDGGANWLQSTSGTTATLRSVEFVEANRGWIVGATGLILRTTDGVNWAPQNSTVSAFLVDVSFLDSTTGVIVGNGGTILRTTDGGVIWEDRTNSSGVTDFLLGVSGLLTAR